MIKYFNKPWLVFLTPFCFVPSQPTKQAEPVQTLADSRDGLALCFGEAGEEGSDAPALGPVLETCNKALEPVALALTQNRDEVTGQIMVCLVNRGADAIAKHSEFFKDWQRWFFRNVFEMMIDADGEGHAPLTDLLRLKDSNPTKAAPKALLPYQEFVVRLKNDGWLADCTAEDGERSLTLGVRSHAELGPEIAKTVPPCRVCQQPVLFQVREEAGTRIHKHCLDALHQNLARAREEEERLLNGGGAGAGRGAHADDEENLTPRGRRTSSRSRGRTARPTSTSKSKSKAKPKAKATSKTKKRSRRTVLEDEEDEEEEEEEEEVEVPVAATRKRRSRR